MPTQPLFLFAGLQFIIQGTLELLCRGDSFPAARRFTPGRAFAAVFFVVSELQCVTPLVLPASCFRRRRPSWAHWQKPSETSKEPVVDSIELTDAFPTSFNRLGGAKGAEGPAISRLVPLTLMRE